MPPVQPGESIAGSRVRLGPLDPGDVPAYTGWINDPEIQLFLNSPWTITEEEEAGRVKALIEAPDAIGFANAIHVAVELIENSFNEHIKEDYEQLSGHAPDLKRVVGGA